VQRFRFRTATVEDLDSIGALMRASVLALFPPYYDERQTASAAVHVAHVDPVLMADGMYFVFVTDGEIVATPAGVHRATVPSHATTSSGWSGSRGWHANRSTGAPLPTWTPATASTTATSTPVTFRRVASLRKPGTRGIAHASDTDRLIQVRD
jgi:hypothetical protein